MTTASTHALALDLDDIQGNILRGYTLPDTRYFMIAITDAAGGRSIIDTLVRGTDVIPAVQTASEWGQRPTACLNVSLTHPGLVALGVPDWATAAFPIAFRQGSAQRSTDSAAIPDVKPAPMWAGIGIGDIGESAPENWEIGGPDNATVHVVISLFTDEARSPRRETISTALREVFAAGGATEVGARDGHTFDHGRIHFGYRDGISQPQIAGRPGRDKPDMQPQANTGDFLLGKDYRNMYLGNYLGGIPAQLGDNGTYLAFRILRQDVAAFERFIALTAVRFDMDPELVAAKLVGRWRNGVPLAVSPDDDDIDLPDDRLNAFDHAATVEHPSHFDDTDGFRCPYSSHMRRMNPRGGPVMGMQHNHRIVRRGVPYGPEYDPAHPDDGIERGLLGAFICGDLANQFEFLMKVWANLDISAPELAGTRDPIIGWQPDTGGRLTLRTRDSRRTLQTDDLPRLVTTRGSLYLFMPGLAGLRTIAAGSW